MEALQFESMQKLAGWFAAYVAEGTVRLPPPGAGGVGVGDEFPLALELPEGTKLSARARVTEVTAEGQLLCTLAPRPDLVEALARHALARRTGRHREPGARRASERYDMFLRANFRSGLQMATEFVTNISRGGLFVRTRTPPPVGSTVTVTLSLPDNRTLDVRGRVVRVVDEERARQSGGSAGAGIVLEEEERFGPVFESLVQAHLDRPKRVLLVDDDRFFLHVLADRLMGSGVEVAKALGGKAALHSLVDLLYDLDAVVLDLYMPGVDGRALIDRIRRFGHEMDLRIVVVSGAAEDVLKELVGPGRADLALSKGVALDLLGQQILAMLR